MGRGGIDGVAAHVGLPSRGAQIVSLEAGVGQCAAFVVDVDEDVVEVHHPVGGGIVAVQDRQVDGLDRLALGDGKGARFQHPPDAVGRAALEGRRLTELFGAIREGDVGHDGVVMEQVGAGPDGPGVAAEGDGRAGRAGACGEGDGLRGPAVGYLDGRRAGVGGGGGDVIAAVRRR